MSLPIDIIFFSCPLIFVVSLSDTERGDGKLSNDRGEKAGESLWICLLSCLVTISDTHGDLMRCLHE